MYIYKNTFNELQFCKLPVLELSDLLMKSSYTKRPFRIAFLKSMWECGYFKIKPHRFLGLNSILKLLIPYTYIGPLQACRWKPHICIYIHNLCMCYDVTSYSESNETETKLRCYKFTCPLQNMLNINNFNKMRGIIKTACYCLFNTVPNKLFHMTDVSIYSTIQNNK